MALPWIVSSAIIALLVAVAMGFFSSTNHMPVEGKTVLLTGASEGLGLSAARTLSSKGANVVIVARTAKKLEAAIKDIAAAAKFPGRQAFHHITADVGAPDYSDAVFAEATEWNKGNPPDIVWCVAGISYPSIFVETPMWSLRKQMDVNFYGMAEMAHSALKVWCTQDAPVDGDAKHFVFTTSLLSFFTVAGYCTYAPSKWALRGLAEGLAMEALLYPQKVHIHVVAPGTMMTAGMDVENLTKPKVTHIIEETDPRFPPQEVANFAIRKLEGGEYMITKGLIPSVMKWGVLGGMPRNNWLSDTLGAIVAPVAYIFYIPGLNNTCRKFLREHGHPSTWAKQPQRPWDTNQML